MHVRLLISYSYDDDKKKSSNPFSSILEFSHTTENYKKEKVCFYFFVGFNFVLLYNSMNDWVSECFDSMMKSLIDAVCVCVCVMILDAQNGESRARMHENRLKDIK